MTKVGLIQLSLTADSEENRDKAESMVRQVAGQGAELILIPELFATPYFCKEMRAEYFDYAMERKNHPMLKKFSSLAKELGVVLPISFFERCNQAHYNSIAIIDADGKELGVYRKSHIPDGVGYEEKYYFNGGDSGFKVWQTAVGNIGVGICWDQWFPEAARIMALKGAEILLYPTAIGSEPPAPDYDSSTHWQNTMCGHAAANIMPLVAANRVGHEEAKNGTAIDFYGCSFIADHQGCKVATAPKYKKGDDVKKTEATLIHGFDLSAIREVRRSWGLFRDRRVDLYAPLLTLDGQE